ncbi:spore coat protein U domain-containing protein [Mesorhizobium sp. MSK_1335]|uniref:Spore coat protein U domain-containing protein n=1 Tax=Mesorhizobium montanum TaxID=3072323 RepID=A0ABU4ZSY0_9HYPH|nr:spore coat protein U domain-containing protein [Mesorhizobium sp. MSK_1335]MDX8528509.1 spore coat protein U domain-containing protein [Mesorhizobium sp. MSK_1335]
MDRDEPRFETGRSAVALARGVVRAAVMLVLLLAFGMQDAHSQSCSVSASSGSYGAIDILSGGAVDTTSTFSVNCTGTANQTVRLCVELSPGQTNSAGNRRLAAGTERLVHELYSDASRTTIWGSWGLATTAYGLYPVGTTYDLSLGSSGSASATVTVYGRVFANQTTAGPGSYIWTMTTAPAASYDYKTGSTSACPTGTRQATSSGSAWTATVNANCTVSASSVNFGSVGVLASNTDATGSITVRCTNSTPYTVGLGAGAGSGATVANRKMTSGAKAVTYSLYSDSARTTVWGNTIGTDTSAGTGIGLDQIYSVYARAPAQITPAPGAYSDTVVVTVTY